MEENQLNIEISDEVSEGIYSNLAIIAHSASEFVIDFARVMPNTPKAKVKSRVVLNAEHAKRLLLALQDNIAKFEKTIRKNKPFRSKDTSHSDELWGNARRGIVL